MPINKSRAKSMKKKPRTKVAMDAQGIDRSLTRIAYEILEHNKGSAELVLVGIQKGGVYLAERLRRKLRVMEGMEVPLGILDINLYRDDIATGNSKPRLGKTEIPFMLDGMKVILVDDVLFTGRTVRAALDALMDFGRPKFIRLAVLVDRGHRELPIMPDYVGMALPSSLWEEVTVHLREKNGRDEVVIETT